MTLVHRNSSFLLSSSLQSSLRLLSTSALCHHPTKLFSLSSRHYYCKVAQNSISNGILSHRTASSMRNGMTSSCRDDEDKDNQKAGEYLLFHAVEIIMLIMILMILWYLMIIAMVNMRMRVKVSTDIRIANVRIFLQLWMTIRRSRQQRRSDYHCFMANECFLQSILIIMTTMMTWMIIVMDMMMMMMMMMKLKWLYRRLTWCQESSNQRWPMLT